LGSYGILDGYEDRLDEDDEQGSRAVPSRTSLGSEAAFIEKFPCYGGTRYFLFGLIAVRNWTYRCELTIPQIEIMMSDLPHVLYKSTKERKTTTAKNDDPMKRTFSRQDIEEAAAANEASIRKARERRMMEQKAVYTTEEIFNGAADED
jgi:hypothetical protein